MSEPITVAYYYRIRWGAVDEFIELFERNHWPILREQLAAGRYTDVRAFTPRFHGDGRADWNFLVTITYRDWAAIQEHSDAEIAGRLTPTRRRSRPRRRIGSPSSRLTGTCRSRVTRFQRRSPRRGESAME